MRRSRNVPEGVAHVHATFNNTIVTITDPQGIVDRMVERRLGRLQGIAQGHAVRRADGGGGCARKGSEVGMRAVVVHVKGPGGGRESAVRALQAAGLGVSRSRT